MFDKYIHFVLNRWENGMISKYGSFYKDLTALAKAPCTIGIIGLQSVGKTTFLNACLGYPLFPSSETIATACPVQIEGGTTPGISVCVKENGLIREIPISVLSKELFSELIEYVCLCHEQNIISLENIDYFSDASLREKMGADTLQLSVADRRHCMVLLLILFVAYVGQSAEVNRFYAVLAKKRELLLQKLGIPNQPFHSINVVWDSSFLENGIRLIDLPGFGSIEKASHDKIAAAFARDCDFVICLTSGEAVGGLLKKITDDILINEQRKKIPHFLSVVNKADMVVNYAVTYQAVKEIFASLPAIPVYFISALSGEYRYLAESIGIQRTLYWKYHYLPLCQDMREMYGRDAGLDEKAAETMLRAGYEKRYPCYQPTGQISECSSREFMENVIPSLCSNLCREYLLEICKENAQAGAWMKKAVKSNLRYFSLCKNIEQSLAEYMDNDIRQHFKEYEDCLKESAHSLRAGVYLFYEKRMDFLSTWQNAFSEMNREFTKGLLDILNSMSAIFGYMPVTVKYSEKGGGEERGINHHVREMVFELIESYDFGKRFYNVFLIYQEAFLQMEKTYLECKKTLHKSYDEFCVHTAAFSLKTEEYAKHKGMDDTIRRIYFNGRFSQLGYLYQIHAKLGAPPDYQNIKELGVFSYDWKTMAADCLDNLFSLACVMGKADDVFQDNQQTVRMVINKKMLEELLCDGLFDEDAVISPIQSYLQSDEGCCLSMLLESFAQSLEQIAENVNGKGHVCATAVASLWKNWHENAEETMKKDDRILSDFQKRFL